MNLMSKLRAGATAVLIIVIISVIILAAGAFFLLKKPPSPTVSNPIIQTQPSATPTLSPETSAKGDDETANWKTYTSKMFGYQIKYPASMNISGSDSYLEIDKQYTVVVSDNDPAKCQGDCGIISSKVSQVKVGDYQGTKYEMVIGGGPLIPQSSQEVVIKNGSKFYILRVNELKSDAANMSLDREPGKTSQEVLNTFDQILSTLKFTN